MPLAQELVDKIQALDPLPVTAQRLIGILGNEDVPINEIVEIVEHDPAVASNLLRLANSPLHGGRFKVERIRDAVVRLGTTTMLDIALGGYLRRLNQKAPLYDLTEDDLWLHSTVASMALKEIMRESPADIPATASIAALVHDIGKVVMVRYQKADSTALQAACQERGLSFIEAERALFGVDHAEVGAAVGRAWNFPEAIIEAIERHHEFPVPEGSITLDAVITANFVTKTIGIGLGAEGLNLKIDQKCLQRLGLDFEKFCRVCARTAGRVAELKQAYGAKS